MSQKWYCTLEPFVVETKTNCKIKKTVYFCRSSLRFTSQTNLLLVLLFHTLAFCGKVKVFKKSSFNDTVLQVKAGTFEYKEDKITMQILNLNKKTIENKHFIHHSKGFRRLCPFVLKCQHLNTIISVFLFLSNVSVFVDSLYIFQNRSRECWIVSIKQTFIRFSL